MSEAPATPPTCGKGHPMVLRVARSGSNAGRQFWGCSTFPQCRETVDIVDPDAPPDPDLAAFQRVVWSDYGRRPGWSCFYAPGGARLRSFDPFDKERVSQRTRRAVSQAAFFVSEHPSVRPGDGQRLVIDLARRLFSRGDRPPVDGLVEDWVLHATGLDRWSEPVENPGDLRRRLKGGAPTPNFAAVRAAAAWRQDFAIDSAARTPEGQPLVDTDAEQVVYEALAVSAGREDGGHWINPQAALGLLTSAAGNDVRRVDFLVCHPEAEPCVIEVDGVQHSRATEVDRDRDQALETAGIRAIRTTTVASGDRVRELAEPYLPERLRVARETMNLVWAPVVAARIGRALLEAAALGWLSGETWRVRLDEPTGVGPVAVRSAVELIAALCDVWGVTFAPDRVEVQAADESHALERRGVEYHATEPSGVRTSPDVTLVIEPFAGPWHQLPDPTDIPTVLVRSALLPVEIRDPRTFGSFARRVPNIDGVSREALVRILQGVFGKREFYPADKPHPRGQEVAVRRVLDGRDTAVLLPTGAGKSLIYQLSGLLLPGVTVVVDPIVALIDDQLEGLAGQGIDRAIGITGVDTRAGRTEAKLASIRAGDAIFSFVAPQRLQSRPFREALRELSVSTPISIAVVDEAHCVSEWGHTFMAAYLGLAHALRETGRDEAGAPPPVLALTGTASRSVLRDMLVELEIDRSDPGSIVVPVDFDRPELSYAITSARDDEVIPRLLGTLRAIPAHFGKDLTFFRPDGDRTNSGIVFVQTVNPSKTHPESGVINLQRDLGNALGIPVGMYAGSAPKAFRGNWDDQRREYARAFKQNEIPLLVATKAFGMGIDKPNIRYTVHLGIPGSIEAFYQEAGRAGRDRQRARCVVVHEPSDAGFWEWAHQGSFKGEEVDLAAIEMALRTIGDLGERRRVDVPMSIGDSDSDTDERAIHRLRLLGVVADYTVDWGGKRFELLLSELAPDRLDAALLAYIRRTQPGRVAAFEKALADEPISSLSEQALRNARHLISFIYDTVASARVQALRGMQDLAEQARSDEDIRGRMLAYLELGKVAGELEALTDREPFTFAEWRELYFRLDTVEDGREWRGATTRLLESSPDHPGLLVGRALAEAIVPEGDVRIFSGGLASGLRSATERYNVTSPQLVEFAEWVIEWLHERKPAWSGLAILIAERDASLRDGAWRGTPELNVIRDTRIADPHELAMAYARTQDRVLRSMQAAADQAREMLIS